MNPRMRAIDSTAASKQALVILAFVAVVLPTAVTGTTHIVGDGHGWALNFDYAKWAQGRIFKVGDVLVFDYRVGRHNVFKVGPHEFQTCTVPVGVAPFTSGHDVIPLSKQGRKWYICGKAHGQHCARGQKLVIDVLPATHHVQQASASAPAWNSDAENHSGGVAPAMANWPRKLL